MHVFSSNKYIIVDATPGNDIKNQNFCRPTPLNNVTDLKNIKYVSQSPQKVYKALL